MRPFSESQIIFSSKNLKNSKEYGTIKRRTEFFPIDFFPISLIFVQRSRIMKKNTPKSHQRPVIFVSAGIASLLLLSLLFIWLGAYHSRQSEPPIFAGVSFLGEYKTGDGEWKTVVRGEHIPSTQGDVTLRGIFLKHNPQSGETLGTISAGESVLLYFNHIGGYAVLPEGGKIVFDAENAILGEDACASMWGSVPSLGSTPITIVLHNPHVFGNEHAIDELFEHLSVARGIYHEDLMLEKGKLQRNVGLLILIISLLLLGIAAFSTVIHMKRSAEMWLIGLMSLCGGVYLLFDAFAVSLWNDSYISNTRILGLSMMLFMLLSTVLIVTMLKGSLKRVAFFAVLGSAAVILCCITLSLLGAVRFFDTWSVWGAVECGIVLILIVCLALSLRHASKTEKRLLAAGLFFLPAFPVDFLATALGLWEGGLVTEIAFFAVLALALIIVLLVIPSHINAIAQAKELEKELQESRISIMLSQMQPHFIFNALNTIYHLCDIDPEKAKSTLSAFSLYLRNNIDNLGQSEMIPFEKELSFINAYLDIERVRFDDELQVFFDIGVRNFRLPPLTVQPLVENAVKHGTSKKEGASQLYISTAESDAFYEIKIRDTGVGFDIDKLPCDGHTHVGIRNVRQRLESLCGGTLTVESIPDVGTTVLIQIPKEETSLL